MHEVSAAEFARLRGIKRLFTHNPKKNRLRLKNQFYAWIDQDGRANFAEKDPGPDRSRSPLIDSCVLVEKKCAPLDSRYERDEKRRQQLIELQYL